MRRYRSGLIVAALALTALPSSAEAKRDGAITSFDGTKIVYSFFPAEGLRPHHRAPTILVGHGYGQSRDTSESSSSEELFGQIGVGPLRKRGYNVLTWDARGFGDSGGKVMVDGPQTEGRDVKALISFVAKQREAQLDHRGDPRLGMAGASYGGGIQLVSAGIDRRIDAIVPDIAWHHLLSSLYKDQTFKSGWINALVGAGEASSFGSGLGGGPAGVQMGDQDPHITHAFTNGTATGTVPPEDVKWFESRGPGALVHKVRIPTLLTQGTADTLFTLREAIENYTILRKNHVPVKMLWFCGGHGVCLTKAGKSGHLQKDTLAWFDRYLKRNRRVNTGPRFEWVDQTGAWRFGGDYPLRYGASLTGLGTGTLALSPGQTSGAAIAAGPAATAVSIPIDRPSRTVRIVGTPGFALTYSGTAAPGVTRLFAQLVDPASGLVLGNQVTPIPVTLDGHPHTIRRPLEPVAFTAAAGTQLKLQVIAGTNVYAPQRSSGLVSFSRVAVRLPVVR